MRPSHLIAITVSVFVIASCVNAPASNSAPEEPEPDENIVVEPPTGNIPGFETEFIEEDFIEIGEMI